MRIVSWNMQGKAIRATLMRAALEELDIDVLIAQEPPVLSSGYSLDVNLADRPRRGEQIPEKALQAKWSCKHIDGSNSNSQDRVFVAWRTTTILKEPSIAIVSDDSDTTASNKRHLVIVKLEGAKQTFTVGTCHAPYLVNDREHTETYMSEMLKYLSTRVDLFMGDTNLTADSGVGSGYASLMSSHTTNGADSNPYDRIYAFSEQAKDDKVRVGRICPPDAKDNFRPPSGKDHRATRFIDLKPKQKEVWGKSDHFAIYIDTDPTTGNSVNASTNVGAFNTGSATVGEGKTVSDYYAEFEALHTKKKKKKSPEPEGEPH